MTRTELEKRLKNENFSDSGYNLYGKVPSDYEGYILVEKNNFWQAQYYERGEYRVLKTFDNEENACDWFYEKLNKDPTMKR
ncbi:MAG: hypothetical protein ACREHG_08660 [Candidatus Saccharimonadales bacterium]